MELNLKKIINIKNKNDLLDYPLNKPIYLSNYLFHYLIEFGNLTALKLIDIPVYIENNDNLNGFHIAAKYDKIEVLIYLIKKYPNYIYNTNNNNKLFTDYINIDKILILLKSFPNLDWYRLLNNLHSNVQNNMQTNTQIILHQILSKYNYKKLSAFLKLYKLFPNKENVQPLEYLLYNKMSDENKISILNTFSENNLNIKDSNMCGLLLLALYKNNDTIISYLLKRNIDINYISVDFFETPLIKSIHNDITKNKKKLINTNSYIIKNKLEKINSKYYNIINKYGNNLLHSIILFNYHQKINNNVITFYYLSIKDNDAWNQYNIFKDTPLQLLTLLDYSYYSPLIKNIKINNNAIIFLENRLKKFNQLNATEFEINNTKLWLKLYKNHKIYKYEKNNIYFINYKYSHHTLFHTTYPDITIYALYLKKKYKNFALPYNSLQKNLTYNTLLNNPSHFMKNPFFKSYTISYYSPNNYNIHPDLNIYINLIKQNKKKRFACVFVIDYTNDELHANILIYDFKKMIIERFEPHGTSIYSEIDSILEEELTWNTGFKYLSPYNISPAWVGFQQLSDESNPNNTKRGDLGGFCFAWCLWYLESKLNNPNIDSNELIHKLTNKLLNMEIKIVEYIRNYSNYIHSYYVKILKKFGIHENEISNSNHTNDMLDKIYMNT
jgi:hypothetical protein